MMSLTYGNTKYGTGVGGGSLNSSEGGLTADGTALLDQTAEAGFAWDISHLAEDGIWQGLSRGYPYVCASHANAQALTLTNRHLSDAVIRSVAEREGVIGIVLYSGFLESRWRKDGTMPITIAEHVQRQASYIAGLAGWNRVGIGLGRRIWS